MFRKFLILVVMTLTFSAVSQAEDVSSLVNELADLKAKVASLEAAQVTSESAGAAESLTTMRRNGTVRIGGEVTVDFISLAREDMGTKPSHKDMYYRNTLSTGHDSTRLDFVINASPDMSLNISLDLDDVQDADGDLLDEAYFAWDHVRGSDFTIVTGKKDVDYGLNKKLGITDSFQNGNVQWMQGYAGGDNAVGAPNPTAGNTDIRGGYGNEYANIGTPGIAPGGNNLESLYQFEGIYNHLDLAKVYVTIFQNVTGMHEDRSRDNGFQSFAIKGEVTPFNSLLIQASFVNHHDAAMGDDDLRSQTVTAASSVATENMFAFSIGAQYEVNAAVEMWTEYQRGYNVGYQNDAVSSTWSLGGIWNVTEAIDFGAMFEWMHIDEAMQTRSSWIMQPNGAYAQVQQPLGWDDQNFYQAVLNGKYSFESGMYLMAEYAYVVFDGQLGVSRGLDGTTPRTHSGDIDRNSSMFGMRVGWEF